MLNQKTDDQVKNLSPTAQWLRNQKLKNDLQLIVQTFRYVIANAMCVARHVTTGILAPLNKSQIPRAISSKAIGP